MINQLLLLSGNDIPFEETNLIIHPPTLKEIAYIGENTLWHGVRFLDFSKDLLDDKDKIALTSKSDFEVLLSIVSSSEVNVQIQKTQMELVLALMFPNYKIQYTPSSMLFQLQGTNDVFHIDKDSFDTFKAMLSEIFCLEQLFGGVRASYNPANAAAEMLVKKFKERKKKLAEQKSESEGAGINVLSMYTSILVIGNHQNLMDLMDCTVFQLLDLFSRYKLKTEFDIVMKAKMAGAKDVKDAEDWMKNLHPEL